MAALLQHQAVLDIDYVDPRDGVRFYNPSTASAPEVTVDYVRWMEMGRPRQVTVTIQPGVRTDTDHRRDRVQKAIGDAVVTGKTEQRWLSQRDIQTLTDAINGVL